MPHPLLDPALIARLDSLELLTHRVFRGSQKGERKSVRKGVSIEFADYRDYARGDDTRHIDWNIFARLERLFIKLYQEEEDLAFYLLVDTSKSMDFGTPETKFNYARRLAAALGYVALRNQDKVGVSAFDRRAKESFRPARGKGQLPKFLNALDAMQVAERTSLAESVRDFCIRYTQPGIVILISDFMDERGYEDALKTFFSRNHEVYCIHLLSREERRPELVGHLELVDSETGERQEVTVGEALRKQYIQTLESFCGGLRDWTVGHGMAYLAATTEEPIDVMLLNYLRRRGLFR